MPAYVLIKVLTPGFYARQDTKTPVRIAVVSMLFNLAGNLTLIWHLGHVGVALATAFSAWVNTVLLYWTLHRRDQLRLDARFKAKALRTILAGAAMGATLWFLNPVADPWMAGDTMPRVIALGALCGVGALVYGIAALLFRAYSVRELKAALIRKK